MLARIYESFAFLNVLLFCKKYKTGIAVPNCLSTYYLRGSLFENLIIAEYVKRKHHERRPPGCYFWRDKSGNEVGLLIDDKGKLTAIEIQSGTTIRGDFFKNLICSQKFSGILQKDCCLIYGP